ncbi:MAG: class I SAM-dependent methyltransferase [Planctomycetota bacterium]
MSSDWMPRVPEPELMDLKWEAEAYANADFAAVHQATVDRMLGLIEPSCERRLLDLGTGPGDFLIRIGKARPTWTLVGLDGAPVMLELARNALREAGLEERARLVLGDAKRAPLQERSFDIVFSNSILHHVADPVSFWREVKRLVKPGGEVFVCDLIRPPTLEEARRLLDEHARGESELLREEFYRSLLAAYTVDEVRAQLREAGLEMLEARQVTDRHLDIFGRVPVEP